MRLAVFLIGISLAAQTPDAKPFVPTAVLGKPYVIGEDVEDFGQIKVDHAKKYEMTLESVEMALRFANRRETLLAGANQKLVIFRGTARNVSPEEPASIWGGMSFGIRVWRRFAGPGEFRFHMMTDPETLTADSGKIAPGGTARFVQVISVPAGYQAMELGFYYRTTKRIAWYDLRGARLASVFADRDGIQALAKASVAQSKWFDLDTLDAHVAGVSRTAEGFAADVDVKNPMLLPSRWGWQYFVAELVGADGAVVRYFPSVEDRTSGKPWFGDLPPGGGAAGRYKFSTGAGFVPRSLRLTSAATGRTVEVELGR